MKFLKDLGFLLFAGIATTLDYRGTAVCFFGGFLLILASKIIEAIEQKKN